MAPLLQWHAAADTPKPLRQATPFPPVLRPIKDGAEYRQAADPHVSPLGWETSPDSPELLVCDMHTLRYASWRSVHRPSNTARSRGPVGAVGLRFGPPRPGLPEEWRGPDRIGYAPHPNIGTGPAMWTALRRILRLKQL